MTTYTVNFSNQTDQTWTFCIYQVIPDSVGLDSVAWKQTIVPKSGNSGVQWQIQYLACTANYKQIGGKGIYTASQKLDTNPGEKWSCVFQDNVQQLVEAGSTTDGQLLISNDSGLLANLGIGMDGDVALVKRGTFSNENAEFVIASAKYYVALFDNLTNGQIMSDNQASGPLEIVFAGGETTKNYVAKIVGETLIFQEEGTDNIVKAPLVQVMERLQKGKSYKN